MNEGIGRSKEVTRGLGQLNALEETLLRNAACGKFEGGNPVPVQVRGRMATLKLVYKCSGRLRADVYKMMRVDTPTIVNRR